jgi:hypothetical protein
MRYLTLLAVGLLTAVLIAACVEQPSGPGGDCLCTAQFAQVLITVADAEGLPVSDVTIEVTMPRTGQVLDSSRLLQGPEPGRYAIFNDGFKDLVAPENRDMGEEIRVVGSLKAPIFDETFRVGVPGECRCHVRKISGPDTVNVH